jgi:hypothetical protein
MAEPGDRRTVGHGLIREFSISRLEKELLAKVYALLVPVAQARCHVPPLPAAQARSRGLIDRPLRNKGV